MASHNLAEFQKTAQDFALGLTPLPDRATVVGLYGDLGSGKTTFVQAVAKLLGVTRSVQSPTFVIMKFYPLSVVSYKLLVHVDAYRLKSGEELKKLGWDELIKQPHTLILVEWANLVEDVMPKESTKLQFEFIDDKTRKISLK